MPILMFEKWRLLRGDARKGVKTDFLNGLEDNHISRNEFRCVT